MASGSAHDLTVASLNEHYDDLHAQLNRQVLGKKQLKTHLKAQKMQAKAAKTQVASEKRKRIYVLEFEGDIKASAVGRLAQQVDALLTIARPERDEVVVRIESPGGTVPGYGLAAVQLMRLREAGLTLTASVDQVAASGGYLMACAASRIIASPFAVVGSIGVIAQVPNLHRLLKKNDIDFEEITAGEFKRSVSLLGEITPAGREHFREKLDTTHIAFKEFVGRHRPGLDLAKVGNGDYWYGRQALELGLVDELASGDAYLFRARSEASIFKVTMEEKKPLLRQLMESFGLAAEAAAGRLWQKGVAG